jgi:hypothetical protein
LVVDSSVNHGDSWAFFMGESWRDRLRKWKREAKKEGLMRWDREKARKRSHADRRDLFSAMAYTRDLAASGREEAALREGAPEQSKAEMRSELAKLTAGVPVQRVERGAQKAAQAQVAQAQPHGEKRGGARPRAAGWTPWKTVTREDGSTYQEREAAAAAEHMYRRNGKPWGIAHRWKE